MILGFISEWLIHATWLLVQAAEPLDPEAGPGLINQPGAPEQLPEQAVNNANPILVFLTNPLNLILLSAIMFMFLVVRPQQRQAKEQQKALAGLKKNDRVVTSGGIHGVVVQSSAGENVVTIRIDENSGARMTVNRDAISKVVNSETKE